MATNNAENLVNGKYDQTAAMATSYAAKTDAFLAQLKNLFRVSMPETDIDYGFIESSLEMDEVDAPADIDDLVMPEISRPERISDFQDIILADIPELTAALDEAPSAVFSFSENPYYSDLMTSLSAAVLDIVENGGTGLSEEVEAAIWERARARTEIQKERAYNEAENYFESRGFTLPPGALSGRLMEAMSEQTRMDEQANYEIAIKQAELAQANTQFGQKLAAQIEQLNIEDKNRVQERALSAAKAAVDIIYTAYTAKVEAYKTAVEAHKIRWAAEEVKVNAIASRNASIAQVYKADVDAYSAQVQAELGIIEQAAKVYMARITGYEARVKVEIAKLNAQVEKYRAQIEQANNQTALSLKEAEMVLQNYLGALQINARAIEAGANVSAQIAASALSAFNASASLSGSESWNYSMDQTKGVPTTSHVYSHSE